MTLWLVVAFVVGALFGKTFHLLAEERCQHLKLLNTTGYRTDDPKNVRCGLRDGHTGPCRFRYKKGIDLFSTTEWHSSPKEIR